MLLLVHKSRIKGNKFVLPLQLRLIAITIILNTASYPLRLHKLCFSPIHTFLTYFDSLNLFRNALNTWPCYQMIELTHFFLFFPQIQNNALLFHVFQICLFMMGVGLSIGLCSAFILQVLWIAHVVHSFSWYSTFRLWIGTITMFYVQRWRSQDMRWELLCTLKRKFMTENMWHL